MRGRLRAHLTYANLASSLALFIVLAGFAWARAIACAAR